MPTVEGAAFAERQGALFVEASAKTAVGVADTFREVVEKILDTPALWDEAPPRAGVGRGAASASRPMPGNITLTEEEEDTAGGGCAC